MRRYRLDPFAVVGLGALALLVLGGPPLAAQTKAYGGRLSPVPITVAMQDSRCRSRLGHGRARR